MQAKATSDVFEEQIRFVCPFCNRKCSIGEIGGVPCGLHQEPGCAKFIELELDEYLHEVNVQLGAYD